MKRLPWALFALWACLTPVTIALSLPGAVILGWEALRGTRAREQPRLGRSG